MALFRRTLTASDGQRRGVVMERPDGCFQLDMEHWDDTAVTGIGGLTDPFWVFEGEERIFPTLESAEAAARAELGENVEVHPA